MPPPQPPLLKKENTKWQQGCKDNEIQILLVGIDTTEFKRQFDSFS